MSPHTQILELKDRLAKSIVGQEEMIDRLLIGLLADGNLLVEGLPGPAKTRAIKSLTENLAVKFNRIEITPNLLPADVTRSEIHFLDGDMKKSNCQQGSILDDLLLVDEINRSPAKSQLALLEAIEERQVTPHEMSELFMVMVTQDSDDQEGANPLPEVKMDGFLMHVIIGYGDQNVEGSGIRLVRGNSSPTPSNTTKLKDTPISQKTVCEAREEISNIYSSKDIEEYIIDLIFATRYPELYSDQLENWIEIGLSSHGGIGLDKCSRAHAWLQGNDFVTPEDVRAVVHNVLRHRLILSCEASAEGITPDQVINEIVTQVAAP